MNEDMETAYREPDREIQDNETLNLPQSAAVQDREGGIISDSVPSPHREAAEAGSSWARGGVDGTKIWLGKKDSWLLRRESAGISIPATERKIQNTVESIDTLAESTIAEIGDIKTRYGSKMNGWKGNLAIYGLEESHFAGADELSQFDRTLAQNRAGNQSGAPSDELKNLFWLGLDAREGANDLYKETGYLQNMRRTAAQIKLFTQN